MAKNILDKSFKCLEIQTQDIYISKLEVNTPDGILTGKDALKYNLEHNENVVSALGGDHYLDYKTRVGGELVEPHIHYYVKLKDSRKLSTILGYINGCTVSDKTYIAPDLDNPDALCVGVSQIETIHSSFSKCYEYLLHKDPKSLANPLKHEYTEEEVHLWICGASVADIVADTEKANGVAFRDDATDFCEKYEALIMSGQLTRSRYIKDIANVDNLDYIRYKSKFERLFERVDALKIAEINKGGSNMEVIYCYGTAGSGKTTFAKEYCKARNYDFFVSGSSNDPFDGYLGEEAIILDDLRGSCFAFADLLKILDPNTRSQVKSRYYNKVVACKVIIITSIMSLDKLYSMFDKDEANLEPLEQLKRRCRCVNQFTDETITSYLWNKKKGLYDKVATIPNTYRLMYGQEEMTDDEKLDLVADMFSMTAEAVKDTVAYLKENKDIMSVDPNGFEPAPADNPFCKP